MAEVEEAGRRLEVKVAEIDQGPVHAGPCRSNFLLRSRNLILTVTFSPKVFLSTEVALNGLYFKSPLAAMWIEA